MAKSKRTSTHTAPTREGWLLAAVAKLSPLFQAADAPKLPENLKVSCGWPKGGKDSRIGEYWPHGLCLDGKTAHIFISPALQDSVEVLDVLVHELVHAVHPKEKHGGDFKKLALRLGLTGRMKATVAGPELKVKLEAVAAELGVYPHAALQAKTRNKPAKGESEWVRVYSTSEPDYRVNVRRDMLEEHGPPVDPWGDAMVVKDELEKEDED